ncbi:Origin recognition complex subunit 4 [Dissostichus eleginoides]|uniref:Origin recognition complex subunit 4 n=1 Tax=Dissostichus eleginoides TaxID=100907 RepID=A0AAD9B853_DISEL|nr:Origin recognition complex subunit 4 [Dissostichus eleginoides]
MGVLHSTQSKEGEKCQHVTELVQADSNSSEEETSTAATKQRVLGSIEGDSTVHMSDNSATKIGAGMPEGSNKLKICVTDDVNIMKLVSGIASDGTTQSPRERGCPKLTKHEEHEESGDVHADISVQTQKKVLDEEGHSESSPPQKVPAKKGRPRKYPLPTLEELNAPKVQKKLGRPRKSLPASSSSPSRDVDTPKKRGRPPGTPKSDVGTPKKRGRPPGTPKSEVGTPHKRGRPRGSVRKSDAKLETTLTEHSEGSDVSSDGEESVE